jgi:putative Mg2+ transporter-C (MgtC) family protein
MSHELLADNWAEIALRILMAAIAGGAVGFNRELRGKPAGLRTHILVSVGAALFIMVPLILSPHGTESASRVIQGVTAGIGFLGAGEILRKPAATEPDAPKVKGLTSAAAIWIAAALGAAAGCGFWQLVVVGASTALLVLAVVWRVERFIARRRNTAREGAERRESP